jgi:hypothetical protein
MGIRVACEESLRGAALRHTDIPYVARAPIALDRCELKNEKTWGLVQGCGTL